MNPQLLEQWQALCAVIAKNADSRPVYLPLSEREGIKEQFGKDYFGADKMIAEMEETYNHDRDRHIQRLQSWVPPDTLNDLPSIFEACLAFMLDHPDAKWQNGFGLRVVVNAIRAQIPNQPKAQSKTFEQALNESILDHVMRDLERRNKPGGKPE
jgi:hypothetical protein